MLIEQREQLNRLEEEESRPKQELGLSSPGDEPNTDNSNNLEIFDLSELSQEAKEVGSSLRSTSTGKAEHDTGLVTPKGEEGFAFVFGKKGAELTSEELKESISNSLRSGRLPIKSLEIAAVKKNIENLKLDVLMRDILAG